MIELILAMQISATDLDRVNREENNAHVYGEAWLGPDLDADYTYDCENYADAKRERLIRQGAEPSDVEMTRVQDENGGWHMVLVYKGETVLDNRFHRTQSKKTLQRYGYKF